MANPPDEYDVHPGIPSGMPGDAQTDIPPGADLSQLGLEPVASDEFGIASDASPADFGISTAPAQSDTQALLEQLSRRTSNTPPHSIEAEQALLGCLMLVANEGFDKISDAVVETDFYQLNHRLIFRAISSLVTESLNPDIVTVSGHLDTHGLLEDAGGLHYIGALAEVTPSAGNIKAYADIVRERSVLRQLISVANEIADSAYDADGRTSKELLDQAETKVFAISDQTAKSAGGFHDIKSVLAGAIERINILFESDAAITGISTGFKELDEKTSGLQQSDLIIVAGRPSMGKTTFAMNIAENAAMEADAPVAVFSMEMPAEQIGMRMIASLGRVELQKLRTGRLAEQDWPRITSAITLLNQKRNVYIDDTPALTPTDLRARARRLAREHGLSLIVIDYLQLMQVAGGGENRATEISEISRSLKALAKELNVPIIALSQLNRSLEQRPDKRPVMSDLRECVTGDTLVTLASGKRVRIDSLVGQTPGVVSLSGDGKLELAHSDMVWKVGSREVFEVSLASGRRIRCTGKHRLKVLNGWARVEQLEAGSRVAIPRTTVTESVLGTVPEHELILLGHLIGDGSYVSGQPLRYTTASEENSDAVKASAEKFGCTVNRHTGKGNWHQLVISGNGNRWHPAGVGKWLKELGIFGQRSHFKQVPDFVFELNKDQLALFLCHLWSTDGCVNIAKSGRVRIYFATASRFLINDVASLLLRFNIVGRIRHVVTTESPSGWYTLDINGAKDQLEFARSVGGFGHQQMPVEAVIEALTDVVSNTNIDTVPIEIFDRVKAEMREQQFTQRAMAAARGTSYGGTSHFSFAPSRDTLSNYAEVLNSPELKSFAENDLFWDRVVDISSQGFEEVFDLTVPGNASWIGNDIVNHNSGAIEQDADVIIFIYRDEVYNPDDEESKGKAEILIRKQRNGPIGTVALTFLGQYTRFENYSPEIMTGEFS